MLGILFIYYIGRYFYRLAEDYEKSQWGYGLFGVVVYYICTFIFGVIIYIVSDLVSPGYMDTIPEMLISLISMPFGIGGCFLAYKYFEKKWKANVIDYKAEIEEIGKS